MPALQANKPIGLLGSMLGRKQMMNVLNALLHGIFSQKTTQKENSPMAGRST
jgi:hypothetical protein